MSNKKILILEGGNNEEHDVSLVTSREIQKILNQNKNATIIIPSLTEDIKIINSY